jgi:hypothetical protein
MGRGTSAPFELPDVIRLAWDEEDLIAASKAEEVEKRLEELEVYDQVIEDYEADLYKRDAIRDLIWANRSFLTDKDVDPESTSRIEKAIESVVSGNFTSQIRNDTPQSNMHRNFESLRAVPNHVPFVKEVAMDSHLVSEINASKTICGKKIPYAEGDVQTVKSFIAEPCEKCSKKIAKDKSLSFLRDILEYTKEALPQEWDQARARCAEHITQKIIIAKKEDWYAFEKDLYKVLEEECISLAAKRLMNMPPTVRFHTLLSSRESSGYGAELDHVLSLYDSIELAYGSDPTLYPWPEEKDLEEFLALALKEGTKGGSKTEERDFAFIAAYSVKYLPEASKRFIARYRNSRAGYASLFSDIAFYMDTKLKTFGKPGKDAY